MKQINLRDDYFIGIAPNAAQDGSWLLQLHTEDDEIIQVKINREILDGLAKDIIRKTRQHDEYSR